MEIGEKEKEEKIKMMEKVVENKVFNQRPPMFSCIRLRKRQHCCKPRFMEKLKLPTSFHSNQARIKFSTGQCVKKYYVILLPQTLVIFLLDGHGFILKRLILIKVHFIRGMRDMQ